MKIVTVDVSNLLAPTPKPIRLAVLCNRSPRYIAAYLRRRGNEGVMVYPFYTGKVEDVPSWSHVRRHDIAKPAYVGNLIPMKSAIDFIVNQFVSDLQRVGPVEIILDESSVPTEEQKQMCIKHNTKQCALVCLSHSCLIPIGECPSISEVWTPEAIKRWIPKVSSIRL